MTLIGALVGWLLHPPFYLLGVIEAWGADEWDLSEMETWDQFLERKGSAPAGSAGSPSSIVA